MNKYQLKQMTIPLIILGVLLLYRLLGNKDDEGNEESTNEGYSKDVATSKGEVTPQPKEKNTYTWYYVGNKGGAIKKIQQRSNMLITMCKKAVSDGSYKDVDSTNIRERIKKIASWEKLKVDGSYGNKTGVFVAYVTGKNNTSLAVMRQKYASFHNLIYGTGIQGQDWNNITLQWI